MIGEDFIYGSRRLSDFNMIMCAPEEEQQFVTRTVDRSEITALRPRPNHYTTVYDDVLVLNFFIMRDELCSAQDEMILSGDTIHYLRSWLESPKMPTELTVVPEGDRLATHYLGIFTSVQPYVVDGDCYGLMLTFTCDSPYGYSDEVKRVFTFGEGASSTTGTYLNYSAELNEYLKPKIVVLSSGTFGASNTLTITNASDGNNSVTITLPSDVSELVIDCDSKIITDGDGYMVTLDELGLTTPSSDYYSFISADAYLFYWLSLVPGENALTFTASNASTISSITVSAKHAIKSGGF